MRSFKRRAVAAAVTLGALGFAAAPSSAQDAVANFYKGKTVTIYIGFSPGGEYDLHGRLVTRFIGKYIPGNPNVIASTKTGAGSINLANFLYSVAPKDGTALGVVSNGLPAAQAIGTKGLNFDARKFFWIGALGPTIETMVTWHTTGVKTIADAQKKVVVAGATGKGSGTYVIPTLLNELFGTKFKIVTGYRGGSDINIAMERGEVGARNNSWTSWKATKPQWLKDKLFTIIAYAGPKTDELPGVPRLVDIAKSPADKKVIEVITAGSSLGRPIMLTPGVPAERVKALRAAFDAVMKDPEFIALAQKSRVDLAPIKGVDMQQVVEDVFATPAPLIARAKAIME